MLSAICTQRKLKVEEGYNADFHPEINKNIVRGEIINSSIGKVEVMEICP